MKAIKLFLIGIIFSSSLIACKSVNVSTDYDKNVDFDQYQTYAFYKPGIDEAEISDLDKRRILRAIDRELGERGMTKSKEPDLLISIFTETAQNLNVYQDYYGWGPYYGYGWGYPYAGYARGTTSVEGTLYIDLIDGKSNNLIWQGLGTSKLKTTGTVDERTENINQIVKDILD